MISDIWLFLRKKGVSSEYSCLPQCFLAQKRLCLFLENPVHRTGGLNVGPAIAHWETKRSYWYLPCHRLCCTHSLSEEHLAMTSFFLCIDYFTEADDSADYVDVLPWRICAWWFRKLPFQDVPRHRASAGESFQLGVLCSRSRNYLLLLQTVRVTVSSASRFSTSYYACLLSNKRSTLLQTQHT